MQRIRMHAYSPFCHTVPSVQHTFRATDSAGDRDERGSRHLQFGKWHRLVSYHSLCEAQPWPYRKLVAICKTLRTLLTIGKQQASDADRCRVRATHPDCKKDAFFMFTPSEHCFLNPANGIRRA